MKNVLVLAPIFFSGALDLERGISAVLAFIAFCFAASGTYAANDLVDLEKDKLHPEKKYRPLANGSVSKQTAVLLAIAMMGLALAIAFYCNQSAGILLLIYLALQGVYSLGVKHLPILDILLLSVFFMLRLMLGVAATGVEPSPWILVVTWMSAFMVATGKRLSEIERMGKSVNQTRPVLLKYSVHYLRHLISSTGAATLVCYMLWCSDNVEISRFTSTEIFPSAIFVAFGILRYELLVFHQQFRDDPTKGIVADIPIVSSALLYAFYMWLIIY